MNKRYLFAFALLLTGCNAQIADYVAADKAPIEEVSPPPPIVTDNRMKISPGYVASSGTTTGAKMNITATNVQMTGSTTGAKLSISASRME